MNINQYPNIYEYLYQLSRLLVLGSKYQPISINIPISTNIYQYQRISININEYQKISTNIIPPSAG
jgi:hypothetical protein